MQPDYTIKIDAQRRFVRLTLFGFWDEATLTRYEADMRRLAAAAKASSPEKGARVLIDMREHTLLSKDHADRLQKNVGKPHPDDRTAILVAQIGVLKLQASRVAAALRPKFFIEEEAALRWLFADRDAPSP